MKTQNKFRSSDQIQVNKTLNYLCLVTCIIIVTCSIVAMTENPNKFFEYLIMSIVFGLAGAIFSQSIKNN